MMKFWRGCWVVSLLWLAGCGPNVPWDRPVVQEISKPSRPVPPTTLTPQPHLRVAVILPTSGPTAPLGKAMLNAAILANYDIHNRNVVLIPMDQAAVERAPNLLTKANTNVIVGPLTAAATNRLQPFARQNDMLMFSLSNNPSLSDDNTIVMGYRVEAEVQRIINFTIARGHSHILAIVPKDAYGNAITAALPAGKTEIIRFSSASELPAALKTVSTKPDAIFLPVSGKELPNALKALGDAGFGPDHAQYVSTGLWDDAGVWQVPQLDGAWYPSADPVRLARYEARYQKQFGAKPPRLTALSYDAVAMIAILEKQPGVDPFNPSILTSPEGFQGADGLFRIMPDGSVRRALAIAEIRQRAPVVIDNPPLATALGD